MVGLDWVGLKMRKRKKLAQLVLQETKKNSIQYLRISVLPLMSFSSSLPSSLPSSPPSSLPSFLPLSSLFLPFFPSPFLSVTRLSHLLRLYTVLFLFLVITTTISDSILLPKKLRKEFDFAYSMNNNAACGAWIDDDLGGGEHA